MNFIIVVELMVHLLAHISASSTTNKDLKCRLYEKFAVVQVHFYFHLVKQMQFELESLSTRIISHSHQAKSEVKNNKEQVLKDQRRYWRYQRQFSVICRSHEKFANGLVNFNFNEEFI